MWRMEPQDAVGPHTANLWLLCPGTPEGSQNITHFVLPQGESRGHRLGTQQNTDRGWLLPFQLEMGREVFPISTQNTAECGWWQQVSLDLTAYAFYELGRFPGWQKAWLSQEFVWASCCFEWSPGRVGQQLFSHLMCSLCGVICPGTGCCVWGGSVCCCHTVLVVNTRSTR